VRLTLYRYCVSERPDGPLPRRVKRRNTRCEQMFSALSLKADSSRTSREVRKVPQADISSILTVRTLGRCKPVA